MTRGLLIGSGISNAKLISNFMFAHIICFMTKPANLRNEYRIGTLTFVLRFADYEGTRNVNRLYRYGTLPLLSFILHDS